MSRQDERGTHTKKRKRIRLSLIGFGTVHRIDGRKCDSESEDERERERERESQELEADAESGGEMGGGGGSKSKSRIELMIDVGQNDVTLEFGLGA